MSRPLYYSYISTQQHSIIHISGGPFAKVYRGFPPDAYGSFGSHVFSKLGNTALYYTHTHTHVRHHVSIYILRWLRKKGIGLFFKVYRALLVRRCFESFAIQPYITHTYECGIM